MKPSEARDKTNAELTKMIAELEEEIFRLRFRKGAGQLKQVTNISKTRRDLARVHTELRQRELAGAKGGA